jgi:hypothetical protein
MSRWPLSRSSVIPFTVNGITPSCPGRLKLLPLFPDNSLVIVYHVLKEEKDYQELGGNYFDQADRQAVQRRLVHRLEKLGYDVALTPASPAA